MSLSPLMVRSARQCVQSNVAFCHQPVASAILKTVVNTEQTDKQEHNHHPSHKIQVQGCSESQVTLRWIRGNEGEQHKMNDESWRSALQGE